MPDTKLSDLASLAPSSVQSGDLVYVGREDATEFKIAVPAFRSSFLIRAMSVAGNILSTDELVLLTGTFTATLPDAATVSNRVFNLKNRGLGVVTFDTDGGEIDGAATFFLNPLESLTLVSDGTDYWSI